MSGDKRDDDEMLPEAEAEALREKTLKQLLTAKPEPQKKLSAKLKERRQRP